ncbi:MAG: hypothetical protein U9O94_10800 [Nanoarchaeota archaeon]|nr:hypothetical protein [Nanoarchaeota archaeon]
MKMIKPETFRTEQFQQGYNILLAEGRLPVAIKQKLYENYIIMEGGNDAVSVSVHEIDMKVLLPYVSVAVLLAIRPILTGV